MIGVIGGAALTGWTFVERKSLARRSTDSVLIAQANVLLAESMALWVCAIFGQLAADGSIFAQPILALVALVAFGMAFNVLILIVVGGKLLMARRLRRFHENMRRMKRNYPVPSAGGK